LFLLSSFSARSPTKNYTHVAKPAETLNFIKALVFSDRIKYNKSSRPDAEFTVHQKPAAIPHRKSKTIYGILFDIAENMHCFCEAANSYAFVLCTMSHNKEEGRGRIRHPAIREEK